MLPKAHLTLHSRMFGFRWVITPWWLSQLLRPLLYSFSVYSCHLFLISSASVRSLLFLSFIWPIFAWNIPFCYCCLVTQFSSVAQSHPILCDPMDCSMPGLPVHHQVPELTQTHVHWVGDVNILWHCLSLRMAWKWTVSSPVATSEFSTFAGILSAALSQNHLLGFEIAELEFHHLH